MENSAEDYTAGEVSPYRSSSIYGESSAYWERNFIAIKIIKYR
jgi:hypothetical protein